MASDEIAILALFAALAAIGLGVWYYRILAVNRLRVSRDQRAALIVTPLLCIAGIAPVLVLWGTHEILEDYAYFLLFLFAGAAVVGILPAFLGFFGLDMRDALENSNPAATTVVCSAMAAASAAYAGANAGEGVEISMTLVPAAMALTALALLWWAAELFAHFSEAVTIGRDLPSALHFSGFLLGCGLILARAVAGDFVSWEATLHDFLRDAWPVLLLLAAAIAIHRTFRPSRRRLQPRLFQHGILPCSIHLIAACVLFFIPK